MRILFDKKYESSEGMAFSHSLVFDFKKDDDLWNTDKEDELNKICGWISDNFSKNFVILEEWDSRTLIAGGNMDNRQAWIDNGCKIDRQNAMAHSEYELRCYEEDASLFLLKWS